jgi:hypothetical protein
MSAAAREARLRELVGAVARQALADRGCRRIALLDDGSPEAQLAARWLGEGVGEERVVAVAIGDREVESVLQPLGASTRGGDREEHAAEVRRLRARLMPDALLANPSNKTALLLGGALPPEPLFPLGDLYASEIEELTGRWSTPPAVRELAERCGGVRRLDDALRAALDGRDPQGLRGLPEPVRGAVEAALRRGSAWRTNAVVVPKIGSRTLGVDLFE